MSNEAQRRILEMVSQGKISVGEAERLLQALGEDASRAAASPSGEGEPGKNDPLKFLHVHVRQNKGPGEGCDGSWAHGWQGKWWARQQVYAAAAARAGRRAGEPERQVHATRDVDVRIPMSLLRSGLKLAAFLPGRTAEIVSARLREQGIDVDLSRLDAAQIEGLFRSLGELTVDLDHGRGQVRITCE
ncbi:MAG TPA: hypothetical protein VIC33_04050 [Vicinamibacterales bacterium]|jgi:hypothetical protein